MCSSIIAIASTTTSSSEEEEDELEEFLCEHSSTGELLPLVADPLQLNSLRAALYNGEWISAESTLVGLTEDNLQTVDYFVSGINGDSNDNGGDNDNGGSNGTTTATMSRSETVVTNLPNVLEFKPGGGNYGRRRSRSLNHQERKHSGEHSPHERDLADYTGTMKVLFVKVTDKNGEELLLLFLD